MNFDLQMRVWGFKRIRDLGETRGGKKKNKSKTGELFSEPQSLVLLQNLELSFVSIAAFSLRILRFPLLEFASKSQW